jgi:hypothetical protein
MWIGQGKPTTLGNGRFVQQTPNTPVQFLGRFKIAIYNSTPKMTDTTYGGSIHPIEEIYHPFTKPKLLIVPLFIG